MTPYRMAPPKLEELRKQLKELLDAGHIKLSKAPFGDEPKTACVTRYGVFDWLVMPFGLKNAPATFCILMNRLFHSYLDQFVVIYLDDIVVYSNNMEDHVEHLCKVFEVLHDNKLCVKREKCSFAQSTVHFLGHTISHGEIRMDSDKIDAIKNWEAPTKVPELRSFLGLANYYRRFIFNYSAIAAPLMDLLKKDREWNWSGACQAAFERMKAAVTEEPVLALQYFFKEFEVHTDASDFAIGVKTSIVGRYPNQVRAQPLMVYCRSLTKLRSCSQDNSNHVSKSLMLVPRDFHQEKRTSI
uniref:Reverse transcriptase domain-containing protein n=1 Tax=Solanum lycopersicum TaxID=4081 RepID=A0A3Q7EWY2_SOLLC